MTEILFYTERGTAGEYQIVRHSVAYPRQHPHAGKREVSYAVALVPDQGAPRPIRTFQYARNARRLVKQLLKAEMR